MDLCKGLELYETHTSMFPDNIYDLNGLILVLRFHKGHEEEDSRQYFEEDGTGWPSKVVKGWVYPYNARNIKYLMDNGAIWMGIMHKDTTTTSPETTTPPTYADYIGEYYYVLLFLPILVLLHSFGIME